ncbi:hypothetical protein PF010_g24086 [Phytophthora fragariae]|uniref:Uncharacterized protein n=1 Tax=Phytophthora fragariae TaxID=53985 RepID=A0A6G0K3L4_9STRA|nr:hypothetical protein PF010_g24086 [Phytophthora fragariae]
MVTSTRVTAVVIVFATCATMLALAFIVQPTIVLLAGAAPTTPIRADADVTVSYGDELWFTCACGEGNYQTKITALA